MSRTEGTFQSHAHPTAVFHDAEKRLLGESARVASSTTNNTVMATLLPIPHGGLTSLSAWRMLRVDVRNLSVQVNHHFDYQVDGHSRKYQLHCESNSSTAWRVYLVRKFDGHFIPYDRVESVTLIALLRFEGRG